MNNRRTVDLNVDAGESFGAWEMGQDDEVFAHMTSANLACGFHAGDPLTIKKTVELAKKHGLQVGAHPSLRDLVGFGRRKLAVSPEEIYAETLYQMGALAGILAAQKMQLRHVSPHGALGWMTWEQEQIGRAVIEAMRDFDPSLALMVLSGALIEEIARQEGIRAVSLAFPERGYLASGRLAPRGSASAVISDPDRAAERAVAMAVDGRVRAVDGEWVEIQADSLLIHGDNPQAPMIAQKVSEALTSAGVEIKAFA